MNAAKIYPISESKSKGDHVRLLTDMPVSAIKPSPENNRIYRPVDPADPDVIELSKSIAANELLEPIVVSRDRYIVSGHRRHAACVLAGLEVVPVRVHPITRSDDPDAFLRLLREHNRQREKTNSERLREEIVSVDPAHAHAELWQYRRNKAAVSLERIDIQGSTKRKQISPAKYPLLKAMQAVIENLRPYWPISDRQTHYGLLNNPPLIHASKPSSIYGNNKRSYRALVDLITRARLAGIIPFEAISDETRSVSVWNTHTTVRSFVRQEQGQMFRGFCRDLMQSQENQIELIGEKNTVASILSPIAGEYCIPLTTGRGYCSLPPRYAMAQRYRKSGKSKLVLLIVSDFDPDGEEIAHSFARSMRDDFGIKDIHPVKVALTAEQVERFNLPPNMQAKESSSNHGKFVDRHGHDVFELEALNPSELQQVVHEAIEAVIDREAYSAEIELERQDAQFLAGVRRTVLDVMSGIDFDADGVF